MVKRTLALGLFDGVHRGHAALLNRTAAKARENGSQPCVVSFDRHPRSLTAHRPVPMLCSAGQRKALIGELYGIDEVIFQPFTEELRQVRWKDYVDNYLLGELGAVHFVVGYDYRLGFGGEGTSALLQAYGKEKGFGCDILSPFLLDGIRVSSTYIRGLVAEGDMESAAHFLGHPYRLDGAVCRGQGLGRVFGFPTVNLMLPPDRQWPVWGVYATRVRVRGESYNAVTNVGIRPTVASAGMPTVESTLFDFDQDVYGETAEVEFCRFQRSERKFDNVEALQAQVREDIREAKAYFAGLCE